jgi:hypothetical protein
MSVTVIDVRFDGGGPGSPFQLEIGSDVTGSFSADDRITITNSGTTFDNFDNATHQNTLTNASGGTSDFQIRSIEYNGGVSKTLITLELVSDGSTTITGDASAGDPTNGGLSGLTFAAYSGGGGGGGGGSGNGKMTIKGTGKSAVKGSGKITIK